MTSIDQKTDSEQPNKNQELILSLTSDEEIIQFNKECEQLTGYLREEVLHKKLSELLLPKESLEHWKKLLESIRQTLLIDQFSLPLKTKKDQTCEVSWNGFLVKDTNGSIKDICLFGKFVKPPETQKQSWDVITTPLDQPKMEKTSSQSVEVIPAKQIVATPVKQEKKKLIFTHEKETDKEHIVTDLKNSITKPLEIMEKTLENTSKKLDTMNKSLKELSRKYDVVTRRLGELEKKDRRLEKKHKNLGKHVRLLETGYERHSRKQKNINIKNMSFAEQPLRRNEFTFFSDPFRFKQQHRTLDIRTQQLEARTSQLKAFEEQLMNERKTFNVRVEEFCRWREKLELLESAIEKRRQELMKQEDVLLERGPSVVQETISAGAESRKIREPAPPDYHELLDKIPQSAAIIQRGMLKQVNSSFASLIGYPMDEIVEKSFFDFIALDGLANVEKYYLDRLKGESVSVYKTIFSTKDNNKISVEVNIKPTIYNGEKAEIVIIAHLEKPDSQLMKEQVFIK
jgi:PAS domain S-box-containing protein